MPHISGPIPTPIVRRKTLRSLLFSPTLRIGWQRQIVWRCCRLRMRRLSCGSIMWMNIYWASNGYCSLTLCRFCVVILHCRGGWDGCKVDVIISVGFGMGGGCCLPMQWCKNAGTVVNCLTRRPGLGGCINKGGLNQGGGGGYANAECCIILHSGA